MQITKTHKIIISIVTVAVLLGVYIAFDRKSKENNQTGSIGNQISESTTTTTTTSSNVGIVAQGTGGYKIEQVSSNESKGLPQPIPDLNRPSTPGGSAIVAPEAKAVATEKIFSLQTSLKKDPSNFYAWLDLAMYQKMAGDYAGAVLSWQYAGKLIPSDFISVANLGNLYAYFLKDNTKAEMYYKQAITKGPTQAYLYTQLAEVYRDVFKDLNKAKAIVDQGLSQIPSDQNLLQMKDSLK